MSLRLTLGLAAAALLAVAAPARANIVFDVSSVTVQGGGTLRGTFTTDDTRTNVVAFDITTPASSPFASFEYKTANASVTAATLPSQYFRIDTPSAVNELQFYFSTGLGTTGGTLLATQSYEHQNAAGNRLLSGSVVLATAPIATPEPISALLLGTGLVGLGVVRRRRTI